MYPSLHDRLKTQHEALERIIALADISRLELHPFEGKWSIRDNIAHLARYQLIFIERIKRILTTDHPHIDRYNAENDPDFENWRRLGIPELSAHLKKEREVIFNLISTLSDHQLGRQGRHTKYGNLTIVQWTEFFLLHEAHHLFTIFQLANDTE